MYHLNSSKSWFICREFFQVPIRTCYVCIVYYTVFYAVVAASIHTHTNMVYMLLYVKWGASLCSSVWLNLFLHTILSIHFSFIFPLIFLWIQFIHFWLINVSHIFVPPLIYFIDSKITIFIIVLFCLFPIRRRAVKLHVLGQDFRYCHGEKKVFQ